jgi:hypothetical protein
MYGIELQNDAGGWKMLLRDGDQTILQSRAASWLQAMTRALEWIETMEEKRK